MTFERYLLLHDAVYVLSVRGSFRNFSQPIVIPTNDELNVMRVIVTSLEINARRGVIAQMVVAFNDALID
jgi:hypothetical protein